MNKSTFKITQMDCPSEENLIRMKLDGMSNIRHLDFDIANRTLFVFHTQDVTPIESALDDLKLGAKHLTTESTTETDFEEEGDQKRLLWIVLIINFVFPSRLIK